MDAYTFLIAFFRGVAPGNWIELTAIHPDKGLYPHPVIDFVEVNNSVALRDALDHMSKLNQQGFGIYFGVAPRKALPPRGKRGSESHVDTILGFWMEIDSIKEGRLPEDDLKKIQAADFVPSFCVLSGGGLHCYYMFDEPLTMADDKRQLIKSAIKGLGDKFGSDNVADFARVLRLPGFVNTKPERGSSPVTFVPPTEKHRYSIDQLMVFAPPAEPAKPKHKTYRYAVTDAVEMAQAALKVLNPSRWTDYKEWLLIGASLKDLGSTGCQLWDEYSRQYPNYEEGVCEKKFATFNGTKHIASLYDMADRDAGTSWRPKPPQPFTVSNSLEILQTENIPAIDYWPTGLPISLRSTLMTYAHPAVAAVLELWCEGIAAGIIPGREITTVQCLMKVSKQLGRHLTESSIRTGLNQGAVQFLRILSQNSISIKEDHIPDQITVTESEGVVGGADTSDCDCPCKNPLNAGRDATYYELLTPKEILVNAAKLAIVPILLKAFPPSNGMVAPIRAEFLALLGLERSDDLAAELTKRYQATLESQPGYQAAMDQARLEYKRLAKALANPEAAPIPTGREYRNSAQYIAACARAIIEAAGGETQYSRATWCNKLGCTDRNLTVILKRAGIRVIKEQTLECPIKSIEQLKAIAPDYNREAKGYPKSVVSSVKPDEPYGFTKKGMIAWAEGELAIGATLSVRYRQANRQTIEPEALIEQSKKRLTHSQIVALRLIIDYWIDNMVADEKLPPSLRHERPVAEVTVLVRWLRLQRSSYMLAWYRWRMRPDVEIWAEQAAQKLSALKVKGSQMIDQATGEIRVFTPAAAIEALAEPDVSPPIVAPENIPKPGADLFDKWQSFADPDARDDWYMELPGADKLALIEYRQESAA